MDPHERIYLSGSKCVQVDALDDGTLFFSGGNNIIGGFEGISSEEISTFNERQPFVISSESTIVVEGYGIALTTPKSEMSNTCVYVNSDSEGKLTISGGQSMIYGTACIDLSKFQQQVSQKKLK